MGKQALAFKAADLGIPEGFSGIFTEKDFNNKQNDVPPKNIFSLQTYLLDRPACEKDTSYRQIIPYTSLRCVHEGQIYIYAYQRAELSGEQRLAGKWSIGLGGHVEELPSPSKGLLDVLADSCARELEEEIGFKINPLFAHSLVSNSVFICLSDTETSMVHLGLAHTVDVPGKPDLKSCEDRVIANEGWLNYETVVQMAKDGLFETWSETLIQDGRI